MTSTEKGTREQHPATSFVPRHYGLIADAKSEVAICIGAYLPAETVPMRSTHAAATADAQFFAHPNPGIAIDLPN